ncbi:bifunctional copper resistance protein CopD/cytochrome c oxidase assembly protein [Kibdelosporangium philippinense]|uniref:Bifunctional copper resistance protein CopD/cytochrome c oxidase assembly protein n=1 Tax=Kibdelosporangium philippinense TaxID=211113 RepID=A0ABS8Z7U1_9PSEU|nr:bifunctional copper resistance protein CopD/cytochrome c oxidase assembly protein [Kibdelosporangium philippinense]MCE7003951.1 bifunctional copper resistance protein CopD/cytochrome c oxidase assembly protein [Kibdelosporangium philippinense]
MRVSPKTGALLGMGAVVACLVAVGLLSVTGNDFTVAGLRGTDLYASYGLPIVRVLAELGAVVCVGGLLLSGFLLPEPQPRSVTTAGWAAVLWAIAAILSIPFTLADVYARPLSYFMDFDRLVEIAFAVEPTRAWMLTALIAIVIAIATRRITSQSATRLLLGLALFGLVPVASSGHSSSGGDHDWATASLLTHLVAAALWVGGLISLVAYRKGEHLKTAVTRFSTLALWCWIALAASGAINALVRVKLPNLFTTNYGLLVIAKAGALLLLGLFGYFQRQKGVKEVQDKGTARALMKLGSIEVLLMLMTIGLAAALARTPPPDHNDIVPTMELKLGYVLSGPPDLAKLLTDWRFDLLLGTAAIIFAVIHRKAIWIAGCAAILIATSSGIGRYAPAVFSIHVLSAMILAVGAPILLARGVPRKYRVLLHPILATLLFSSSCYLVYFTGVFEWSLDQPVVRTGIHLWFLVVGLAFFMTAFAAEVPVKDRRRMVFAALATQTVFAGVLLLMDNVIGERFYLSLKLPWTPDFAASQQLGGAIAIGFGVAPLLIAGLVLLVTPQRATERELTAIL